MSLRFGGPEGESIHVWEEAMKARKSTYLVPWLVGDRGPGMRLKRARKWHMNRSERRAIAMYTAEHLKNEAILAGSLEAGAEPLRIEG